MGLWMAVLDHKSSCNQIRSASWPRVSPRVGAPRCLAPKAARGTSSHNVDFHKCARPTTQPCLTTTETARDSPPSYPSPPSTISSNTAEAPSPTLPSTLPNVTLMVRSPLFPAPPLTLSPSPASRRKLCLWRQRVLLPPRALQQTNAQNTPLTLPGSRPRRKARIQIERALQYVLLLPPSHPPDLLPQETSPATR